MRSALPGRGAVSLHKYPRKEAPYSGQSSANRSFQMTALMPATPPMLIHFFSSWLDSTLISAIPSSMPSPSLHAPDIGPLWQDRLLSRCCISSPPCERLEHTLWLNWWCQEPSTGCTCSLFVPSRADQIHLQLKASPGAITRRHWGGQHVSSQPDATRSTQGPPQEHACIWSPQNGPVSTHKSLPIASMFQKPPTTPLLILRLLKSALLFSQLGSRLS